MEGELTGLPLGGLGLGCQSLAELFLLGVEGGDAGWSYVVEGRRTGEDDGSGAEGADGGGSSVRESAGEHTGGLRGKCCSLRVSRGKLVSRLKSTRDEILRHLEVTQQRSEKRNGVDGADEFKLN